MREHHGLWTMLLCYLHVLPWLPGNLFVWLNYLPHFFWPRYSTYSELQQCDYVQLKLNETRFHMLFQQQLPKKKIIQACMQGSCWFMWMSPFDWLSVCLKCTDVHAIKITEMAGGYILSVQRMCPKNKYYTQIHLHTLSVGHKTWLSGVILAWGHALLFGILYLVYL